MCRISRPVRSASARAIPPVAAGGFLVEASIEEKNFLGRGQYIRLAAGRGDQSRTYNVSFTEPYFLGYRLAAGFDVFQNENDYDEDNYSYEDKGFSLRVTAPITERLSTTFRYNLTQLDYSGDRSRPVQPIPPCDRRQHVDAFVGLSDADLQFTRRRDLAA